MTDTEKMGNQPGKENIRAKRQKRSRQPERENKKKIKQAQDRTNSKREESE